MRLVFAGTPELAVPTLEAISKAHEIAAVVCQPDKPQGRSKKLVPPPVKVWALNQGMQVYQPEKLNDGAFEQWLQGLRIDAGVIVAYGRLLKQPILEAPARGWLNMHPSLLPRWRGPSPIQTALIHGDQETGVSIMRLALAMDAGDLLLQESTPIGPEEDGIALTDRLAQMGARMMVDALTLLEAGNPPFTTQSDADATFCQLFTKQDGQIRWGRPAVEIHNRIRGCLPWPVAHTRFRGETYRILQARVEPENYGKPGEVIYVDKNRLLVGTGDGALSLLKIQAPGKRPVSIAEFLRGHDLRTGECFEDFD